MHGKLGQPDVHRIQRHLGSRDVAKRRASQNIRTVEKLLHWYTGSFTDLRKYCRSHPIRGILLVRAVFYHDSFIQIRPIGRAGLLGIIGMYAMSIVRRQHEAGCQRLAIPAFAQALH